MSPKGGNPKGEVLRRVSLEALSRQFAGSILYMRKQSGNCTEMDQALPQRGVGSTHSYVMVSNRNSLLY
jgi:hypothetical protein